MVGLSPKGTAQDVFQRVDGRLRRAQQWFRMVQTEAPTVRRFECVLYGMAAAALGALSVLALC